MSKANVIAVHNFTNALLARMPWDNLTNEQLARVTHSESILKLIVIIIKLRAKLHWPYRRVILLSCAAQEEVKNRLDLIRFKVERELT